MTNHRQRRVVQFEHVGRGTVEVLEDARVREAQQESVLVLQLESRDVTFKVEEREGVAVLEVACVGQDGHRDAAEALRVLAGEIDQIAENK